MARNPYYDGPVSDHFDGLRFFRPAARATRRSASSARCCGRAAHARALADAAPALPCPTAAGARRGRALRVTLHRPFQLSDPDRGRQPADRSGLVRARRAVRRSGPKRATPPALALDDLPPLDAMLLSHNHYDHMDLATLARLAQPRPCPVLTPLGNDTILRRADAASTRAALDWGEACSVGAAAGAPSSRRCTGRRAGAATGGWRFGASFMIEGAAGDRSISPATPAIGDGALFPRHRARGMGRIRLALLPIGAYAPRWFMRDQHCDPDEAVAIFERCGADRAVGCHWGTFRLTDEAYDEPPRRLAQALAKAGIAAGDFVARRRVASLRSGDRALLFRCVHLSATRRDDNRRHFALNRH